MQKFVKIKKTIKKYKLGKNLKNRSIAVLVKSGRTRKLVKNEHNILRKKCLSEIKQYLRKHNLIKIVPQHLNLFYAGFMKIAFYQAMFIIKTLQI